MSGRPYEATLTVQCTSLGCECTRDLSVKLFAGEDNTEVIERRYEKQCAACGHSPMSHVTVSLVRAGLIERRVRPRE